MKKTLLIVTILFITSCSGSQKEWEEVNSSIPDDSIVETQTGTAEIAAPNEENTSESYGEAPSLFE